MTAPEPAYRKNAQGHLIPLEHIPAIDLERDKLVLELISRAEMLHGLMLRMKVEAFADFGAFVELSAEQYGAHLGGKKGNVTLPSFDGKYKVVRQIQESITFDERLQAAKALIDECITTWSEGSHSAIRVLVQDAFQVDQEGRINKARILGLRRLQIDDEKWQNAMRAISDSVQVHSSRSYIRFYKRVGETDQYQAISLDFANI